jgi:hypothetical protein
MQPMIARATSQELRALTPRLNPMSSARGTAASQPMVRCGKAAPKALPGTPPAHGSYTILLLQIINLGRITIMFLLLPRRYCIAIFQPIREPA